MDTDLKTPAPDDATEHAALRSGIIAHRFAVISGAGWLIDFSLFNGMVAGGILPGRANLVSAGVALLFVFLVSRHHLFREAKRPLPQAMALYAAYNVIAVIAASALIGALSGPATTALNHVCPALSLAGCGKIRGLGPALVKIAVTPATMYANFMASAFINLKQIRFL